MFHTHVRRNYKMGAKVTDFNPKPDDLVLDLIQYLSNDRDLWVPFASFSLFEYYLSNKRSVNLNFNINNYYFLWHYMINKSELVKNSYNVLKDKEKKTISELSTKSDKTIVRAAATLVILDDSLTEGFFDFISSSDFSNIILHKDQPIDKQSVIFQDLDGLIDSEIEFIKGVNHNKILTTSHVKHLLHFDGFDAAKISSRYFLWSLS